MNDQISADLQRLIGRVWMAAFEAGKREALAPKDPDMMRREALAAALAQDGADDRVRADWSAGEPISPGDRIIDTQGREQVAVEITPINRADVRLKVGDVVETRIGVVGKVTEADDPTSKLQPVWIDLSGARSTCYTPDGLYWASRAYSGDDIVTLNGRPIIDSEEA